MSACVRLLASVLSVLLLLGLSIGCEQPRLRDATGELKFVPDHLDLGDAITGTSTSAEVVLVNGGRAPIDVTWEVPADPWAVSALPSSVPSGEVRVRITFQAREPGAWQAVLKARGVDRSASVALTARSVPLPECPTPPACHVSTFDVAVGRCVESVVPDGEACDPHNLCVMNAFCLAGRCTGTPVACDDGNACTVDSCNPLRGCESQPGPPCPGDGKCRVGTCDPKTGCGLAPAEDGTVCGAITCDAAEVCVAGNCVVRDPPDGFMCDVGSPCRSPGICRGSSCVQADATPLMPKWSRDTASSPDSSHWHHDFVLEPSGEMSLMGFFSHPSLRSNGPAPVDLSATARRCILWNRHLACVDFGPPQFNGAVALVDLATGAQVWSFSLAAARPDLAAQTRTLFMARIAAVGTDRLAALFEAYPAGSDWVTDCRAYFLAMLDAGGALVAATRLVDPFLSICNHPHPYGVAADRDGNLYLQFSPSTTPSAPLESGVPALTLSYTRDAILRWSRVDPYRGGELAIANGLLFPENASVPHDTATGQPLTVAPLPPGRLGRVVSDGNLYVRSPAPAGSTLDAFDRSGNQLWTSALPPGDAFISPELRLAAWTPTPGHSELVVLTATARLGTTALTAYRARDGAELWSCALGPPLPEPPQLFEVGDGSLGVMSGAATCGPCDPPFADSHALFRDFSLPGLSPAFAPWIGTFGGPGHDHLEDAPPVRQFSSGDSPPQ